MSLMSALSRATPAVDFEDLYRDYAPSVYRYTYAVLGNHADAEDVTQQTFMNAYRACAHGTKPRKAENWLLRIAHNEVRRHFQRTQRKAHELQFTDEVAQPRSEHSDPSLAEVLRALQSLPATQRAALVMREFEGRPYAEIAKVMGMSQSALEGHIFRARRALAEQLEDALTCGDAKEAVLRRLDRRLPRRTWRRLKEHLQECPACERFENVQRRHRRGTLLKGLPLIPIPASFFLFRAKEAAAGLAPGAAAAGGSATAGGGTAVGAGAGLTLGVAAKVAAVTAAVAVAGGAGSDVSTGRIKYASGDRKVVQAPVAGASRDARGATDVRSAHGGRAQPHAVRTARDSRAHPGRLRSAIPSSERERDEAESRPMQPAVDGRESGDTREQASHGHKARLATPPVAKPRLRPTGEKSARTATIRQKQTTTRRGPPSPRRSTPAQSQEPPAKSKEKASHSQRTPQVEEPPKIDADKGRKQLD